MPKKKFFSSIFSRSSKAQTAGDLKHDQLETDAVPMPTPDENSNESLGVGVEEIHNSTPLPSGLLSSPPNSQQLIPSPTNNNAAVSPLSPMSMPHNNNVLAMHSTHAQNVFHFSNISKLHIGSVYKIRTGDAEEQPPSVDPSKEQRKKMYTRTIQAMQQSTERLGVKYLSEIAKHLGEGWQDVMRQLKFSEGQIHQFTVDFHMDGGLKEIIYQLLLDWSRNEENATLGEITSILWNSGHHETVFYLKQVYKADRNAGGESKSEKMFCE